MSDSNNQTPNADEVAFWNGRSGEKWVETQETQDRMLGPPGIAALNAARISAGEAILDIGCGCGDSSIEIARRGATVLGVDVSDVMLAKARQRAGTDPSLSADFLSADAEIHRFDPGSFDLVYSRFGVMFFENPDAAFVNLGRALKPGGRLAFVCWRALRENDWVQIPTEIASRHTTLPASTGPFAPGPFAFADPDRIHGILDRARFGSIDIEPCDAVLPLGEDMTQAVRHSMQMTPVAGPLAKLDREPRARVAEDLRAALAAYERHDGVFVASGTWIVTAVKP